MKKIVIPFLQCVIVLFGIAAFIFLLWEPHLEGRNVGATLYEIYFADTFLAYAYIASILFFVMLYQTIRLLGNIGKGTLYSASSVKRLRTIRDCAIALLMGIIAAEAYLMLVVRGTDDIAGGVAMGLAVFVLFLGAAITAQVLKLKIEKSTTSFQ